MSCVGEVWPVGEVWVRCVILPNKGLEKDSCAMLILNLGKVL